jgi:hypothetical protein
MTHDGANGRWPMKGDALLAAASAELPGEEVLAAGLFSLEVPARAAVAGGAAGGIAGGLLGDVVGEGRAGDMVGSLVGMQAAESRNAAQQGLARQLVVAITPERINVISREPSGTAATKVVHFDRATCQVEVKNAGIAKFVHLTDPNDGRHLKLGASTLSKPDRAVMKLLTADRQA